MSKMKTVKEVFELTGLNRKLLHDYDHEGIVKPSAYANAGTEDSDGYKLYDEDAFIKLQQIAIFRKLRLSRSDIKKKIADPNYDSNQLLEDQILMLKKEKEEIETLLTVAEQLKLIGMKGNTLDYFSSVGITEIARNAKRWQNSAYFQELCDMLENTPEEEYDKESYPIIEELLLLNENECNTRKAMNIVTRLFEVNIKYYGMAGSILVSVMALSGQSGGQLAIDFNNNIGMDITKVPSKAIMHYLDVLWNKKIIATIKKFYDVIGSNFEGIRVKEMVDEIKVLLERYLGINKKEDYQMLFEFAHIEPYKYGGGYIQYVFSALKYYCT
jgi:DNA-binding transcriptional MerR regulator